MAKDVIIIADYSEDAQFTVHEVCEICQIEVVTVNELISYEIIFPISGKPDELIFDMQQLKRLKTAMRLQRDLELNLAGVALVLDLLEEMEDLRAQAEILEKHLLK